MKRSIVALLALAAVTLSGCGQTPTTMNDHSQMTGSPANQGMNSSHGEHKTSPGAAQAPYDLQFLDTMVVHHQGALDMAKMAQEQASHPELKEAAGKMVSDQQKEMEQMHTWRAQWYESKPAAVNMELPGMGESMDMSGMDKLPTMSGNEFDLMFVGMMIPHHQGAVTMSEEALKKAEHAEIKQLAQKIIQAQKAEIATLASWKKSWTAK